jgi:glycosyltransferase involved in cell wall biosynthesis
MVGDGVKAEHSQKRSRQGRRISIIAPCYNEESALQHFFARMQPVLDNLGMDYELVFVNDGSRDSTLAQLLTYQQRDQRIKILDFARNFGKEVGLSAGLDAATGDVVVPIDVDLQDPPELIADFVAAWEQGADIAYGVRADRSSDTALKRFTAQAFYRAFNSVSDVSLPYNAGDYRLLDRSVVEVLKQLPERNRFMKGLFTWVGFQQVPIPYVRAERVAGSSSWRYWKLWNFALDGITSFSTAPIRIWTYVGITSAALAVLYALVVIVRTILLGRDVAGYASLMVVLLMSFGLQMVAVGVLGEYVSRIYQEVKGRPLYIIKRRYGFAEEGAEANRTVVAAMALGVRNNP